MATITELQELAGIRSRRVSLLEARTDDWGTSMREGALAPFYKAVKKHGLKVLTPATDGWGKTAFRLHVPSTDKRYETHIHSEVMPNGKHVFSFAIFPPMFDRDDDTHEQVSAALDRMVLPKLRALGKVNETLDRALQVWLTVKPGMEDEALKQIPKIGANLGTAVVQVLKPKNESIEIDEDDWPDLEFEELREAAKYGKPGKPYYSIRVSGHGIVIDPRDFRGSDMKKNAGNYARKFASRIEDDKASWARLEIFLARDIPPAANPHGIAKTDMKQVSLYRYNDKAGWKKMKGTPITGLNPKD